MKELFDLFQSKKSDHELYNKVIALLGDVDRNARGEENEKAYSVLRLLMNSINNAGCEDRRDAQIALIGKEMGIICDEYENFLP